MSCREQPWAPDTFCSEKACAGGRERHYGSRESGLEGAGSSAICLGLCQRLGCDINMEAHLSGLAFLRSRLVSVCLKRMLAHSSGIHPECMFRGILIGKDGESVRGQKL